MGVLSFAIQGRYSEKENESSLNLRVKAPLRTTRWKCLEYSWTEMSVKNMRVDLGVPPCF